MCFLILNFVKEKTLFIKKILKKKIKKYNCDKR